MPVWAANTAALTLSVMRSKNASIKVTSKGQVTIPPDMRRKHGLLPHSQVELVDQPDGILVVKAGKLTPGRRVLATLLRGGKIKGRTKDWLRMTRG
jgi:AbrB family looped-hinge helix DNA binding protein